MCAMRESRSTHTGGLLGGTPSRGWRDWTSDRTWCLHALARVSLRAAPPRPPSSSLSWQSSDVVKRGHIRALDSHWATPCPSVRL
eukprot:998219-Prymnesium_polylepis.3